MKPLGPDGDLQYKRAAFNHKLDDFVDSPLEKAAPDSILLFDGIFLQRPDLVNFWDYVIFVDVDFELSVPRALDRNQEESEDVVMLRERYERRYVPAQRLYFTECHPRRMANAVVGNNDFSSTNLCFN